MIAPNHCRNTNHPYINLASDASLMILLNALAGDEYRISSANDHGLEASQRLLIIKKLVR